MVGLSTAAGRRGAGEIPLFPFRLPQFFSDAEYPEAGSCSWPNSRAQAHAICCDAPTCPRGTLASPGRFDPAVIVATSGKVMDNRLTGWIELAACLEGAG